MPGCRSCIRGSADPIGWDRCVACLTARFGSIYPAQLASVCVIIFLTSSRSLLIIVHSDLIEEKLHVIIV